LNSSAVRRLLIRGLRALLAGIQKLEVASGEIPLFAQVLGHPRERSERRSDPT
jgi:hypothetical protein